MVPYDCVHMRAKIIVFGCMGLKIVHCGSITCSYKNVQTTLFLLSLSPTMAVLRYDDMQYTSSSGLHLEDIECGSCGLNMRKSPGRRATAIPILGKQK